jgi:RHS repeat-associated protein
VTYTWDDRGNLTNDGTFTYTYNAAGRLVQAESITSTLVYTYTATGLRVGQRIDGDEATYAWDWASGLPEMLSEGGNLYLVGHNTLGQWNGDEWVYYLLDGLGSVRQVTDETGAVVSAREWTPYGVEVGSAQAGLGYTGEWQDPALGMTYLRARWYDAYLNQFVSPDPIVPDYRNPQSINGYTYALGNPIGYTDPTGKSAQDWPDRDAILELRDAFFGSARRHYHPESNMSITAFASLLAAIVHQEGRLYEDEGLLDRDAWDSLGDIGAYLFYLDTTVGIVNIKPSTVQDLCEGIVRGTDHEPLPGEFSYTHQDDVLLCIPQCSKDPHSHHRDIVAQLTWGNSLRHEAAIDALAMNMQAGVDRALHYKLEPSVYNLAMWHHRGMQQAHRIDELSTGEKHYGGRVVRFTEDAMNLFGISGWFHAANENELDFFADDSHVSLDVVINNDDDPWAGYW